MTGYERFNMQVQAETFRARAERVSNPALKMFWMSLAANLEKALREDSLAVDSGSQEGNENRP
jgi:hypothetical protein